MNFFSDSVEVMNAGVHYIVFIKKTLNNPLGFPVLGGRILVRKKVWAFFLCKTPFPLLCNRDQRQFYKSKIVQCLCAAVHIL